MGKDFPAPWKPITNPVDLAILGKLQEELGELQSIVARIIIQGMNEVDPDTNIINRKQMEDEIADVYALCKIVTGVYFLNNLAMNIRTKEKMIHIRNWIVML